MSFFDALSAIREVVVSKVFDFLIDKLVSSDFLQFATEEKIHLEVEKLRTELLEIRAVLDDAEERQLKDESVKIWLSNLQNLAYDVDDILDEIATDISMRNLMMERRGSSSKKPRLMISDSYNAVMFNRDMMSKINDVTARLKDLEPQTKKLQKRTRDYRRSKRIEERPQPTSVEIETHVYGRDKDKETILELLFKSDDERNFVIPIVGMGGVGKTTLAQLVYNDASIQNHFDLKAWVCVSDDFDVTRITKAILESVGSVSGNGNELTSLQEKLKNALSEKIFLIVLDDVWNEDYNKWTILQSPFLKRTPGSKIIVTTRNLVVSNTMGASHAQFLELLSEDDCLSIFAQHALGATNFRKHPNLKAVAEKIVRKCNGLPLAAKTIGGLLRTNVEHDAWKNILESEIWQLSEHQCGIIPALQLSYHHLPPHLRRCFAYCSIFPKDYEFEEEEIILLWKAEGFLQEARDRQRVEDLGHQYFRNLLSRSLLQISSKDNSRFVMHDLIHDLAQSVAGEICFRIEGDKQISKQARHLSYVADECDGIKKFEGVWEAKYLRTFLPLRLSSYGNGFVTSNVLTCLLPGLRFLRVLSLKGYKIEVLPDFIGDLKHLRHLDISRTFIRSLPESISTLYNLETLLLRRCEHLVKLPSEMENLVNLCHLDITDAIRLQGMPSNFGTLTNLQTLSNFVVDACGAKLQEKMGLDGLELKWCSCFGNATEEVEKKVLDSLRPSKKLKKLTIMGYCGDTLAKWVGDSSFNNLLSLSLINCLNCMSLPSIGKLPLLKEVCIQGLHNVTSVGLEFLGENTPNAFSSLEILRFGYMLNWENWEVDDEAMKFSKLRELHICYCSELLGSIPESLPALEKLVIKSCEKLEISISSFPKLSELEIDECEKVVYKGFADHSSLQKVFFSNIPKFTCTRECLRLGSIRVESLKILRCEELLSSRENNWGLLTQSMSLGNLTIRGCAQLLSIGVEGEREELMQLKIPYSIEHMVVEDCEKLEKISTTLQSFTSLRVLVLESCPKLISLSKSNLPLSLNRLRIWFCHNLRCLWDEGENINIDSAFLLEHLNILGCSSLVSLSSRGQLPRGLKELQIEYCPKLESIAQEIQQNAALECILISDCDKINYLPQGLNRLCHLQKINIECTNLVSFPEIGLPATNLKVLYLSNCTNLQDLPHGIYNLNCLEDLRIRNCPSLTSFPEEGIPTTLKSLHIEGPNIYKLLTEWGLHKLTSLKSLSIKNGCPDAVSFPQVEIGMMLPCSLTTLEICDFPKLEILSSNGFQNLTSLESLVVKDCPNLKSLPEKGKLSSLLMLDISRCAVLRERCEKDKGPEWSKIAHIPCFHYESDDASEYDDSGDGYYSEDAFGSDDDASEYYDSGDGYYSEDASGSDDDASEHYEAGDGSNSEDCDLGDDYNSEDDSGSDDYDSQDGASENNSAEQQN
ncbi:LRR and NB-ARC domains-containing disease resistance protein, putative [Theobroma cacao]|uniref:LRR and NB-ARC domains-containing disease resistance protein, putative n=1 Tax=Theobroma cacao TaxID=3641 RepID=A0A061FSW7_THECC|nr:LRR and NB-ARC domains-containing disease resistance protein, putative [Theobroma cacao]